MTAQLRRRLWTFLLHALMCVLFFAFCLSVVGTAGYAKVRMDNAWREISTMDRKSETAPAASLGYGGFLGAARFYMNRMDRNSLDKMRQAYEKARDEMRDVESGAPPNVQRDIDAILSLYNDMLLRAETNGDAFNSGLTPADLALIANAHSSLEKSLQTLAPVSQMATNEIQKWSLVLTAAAYTGILFGVFILLWRGAGAPEKETIESQGQIDSAMKVLLSDLEKSVHDMMQIVQRAEAQAAQALAHSIETEKTLTTTASRNERHYENELQAIARPLRALDAQIQAHFAKQTHTSQIPLNTVVASRLVPDPSALPLFEEKTKTIISEQINEGVRRLQTMVNLLETRSQLKYDELSGQQRGLREMLETRLLAFEKHLHDIQNVRLIKAQDKDVEEKQNAILNEMMNTIACMGGHINSLYEEANRRDECRRNPLFELEAPAHRNIQ